MSASLAAGAIVVVDWRDALPREPGTLRPAVVVEDADLFDPSYPNVILVPLADDPALAIADLAVPIAPTQENGCPKPCHALARPHHDVQGQDPPDILTHHGRTTPRGPPSDRDSHRARLTGSASAIAAGCLSPAINPAYRG